MTVPFMDSYVRLLIQTCHRYVYLYKQPLHLSDGDETRRKVAAMGGMAAQIPIKNDPAANDAVMEKVRLDKLREVLAGHDGTWIAHPLINKIALAVFNEHMLGPNQVRLSEKSLLLLQNHLKTYLFLVPCPS